MRAHLHPARPRLILSTIIVSLIPIVAVTVGQAANTQNVNVVNTPSVSVADTQTVLLADQEVASGVQPVPIDVSTFKEVRVVAVLTIGPNSCSFIVWTSIDPDGTFAAPLGVLTMTTGAASEAFQIPGRTLEVGAGANGCAGRVAVYGRTH